MAGTVWSGDDRGPGLRHAGRRVRSEFIGEITDREKNEFLGRAGALLFPIEWPEPFGLAMIEALACGTPGVASDLSLSVKSPTGKRTNSLAGRGRCCSPLNGRNRLVWR